MTQSFRDNDYQRRFADARAFDELINRAIDGEGGPTELPWSDPMFQDRVRALFAEVRKWRQDSKDLAVIARVFGGMK